MLTAASEEAILPGPHQRCVKLAQGAAGSAAEMTFSTRARPYGPQHGHRTRYSQQ